LWKSLLDMKFESILQIILFGSSIGLAGIIFKKIPLLRTLPVESSLLLEKKQDFVLRLKTGVRRLNPFKNLSYEMFLEKLLTSLRALSLRIEGKTSVSLQQLKQAVKEKKIRENDNYWEEIKRTTEKKSKSKK